MWTHHLLVTLRAFRGQRGLQLLNVGGLAVGLACALLVGLYVRHERAYDRHLPTADRVYRLTTVLELGGDATHYARSSAPVGRALQEADPAVEAVARLEETSAVLDTGGERFYDERVFYADPTVFEVFGLPLRAGSAATALTAPGQVVLTETAAQRYFGGSDALGQTLRVGAEPFEVVGVVPDVPAASHLHYDALLSMRSLLPEETEGEQGWADHIHYLTYVLVRPGTRPEALEARLAGLVDGVLGELIRHYDAVYAVHLQPLTAIHLHSSLTDEVEPGGDVLQVLAFGGVGLAVLLVACINFTNLATARALDRGREVGLRKALGARRGQLVRQFLTESLVLTGAAAGLAVGLAVLALPLFNALTGRALSFGADPAVLGLLLPAVPVVALLAGAHPAFLLSGYRPVETLRGRFRSGSTGLAIRRTLVVAQFALSAVLVAGSFVVQRQLAYTRAQRLGFERAHVVVVPLGADAGVMAQEDALKRTVLGSSAVVAASLADQYPSREDGSSKVFLPAGRPDAEGVTLWTYSADADFLATMDMEVAAGRLPDPTRPADSAAVLLNETAFRQLGYADVETAALVEPGADRRLLLPVAGVVRDFHVRSFRHQIEPVVIRAGARGTPYGYLLVRVEPGRLDGALADVEAAWTQFANGTPFSPLFLDEEVDQLYRSERQLGRAVGVLTGLAVVIACLGLLGLSAYSIERRRREIGVRKVLGASVSSVVARLSLDVARPVLVAVVVAAPVAYVASEQWLELFAYRVALGPGPFVLAGVLVVGVALATVGVLSTRAALADPVRALRAE